MRSDNNLSEDLSIKATKLPSVKNRRTYPTLIVSLIYTIAVLMVPWEDLQGFLFVDRHEYLEYFLHEEKIFEYKKFEDILDYLKHEALWHYAIDWLVNDLGVSITQVFLVISFLSVFSASLFLVSRHGYMSAILLTNPLLITLAFSQLRLALAFSVMLLAYMSKRNWLIIISILTCAFVHTATFLFVGVVIAVHFTQKIILRKEVSKNLLFFSFLFIGLCVSLALGPALDVILSYFGDRRAVIYIGEAASGIKYTLYWAGLLLLCGFQRRSFFRETTNGYTIIILSTAIFNLLTGGYTSRLIAVSLPMIFSTVFDFKQVHKHTSLILYVFYVALQWVYWLPIRIFS